MANNAFVYEEIRENLCLVFKTEANVKVIKEEISKNSIKIYFSKLEKYIIIPKFIALEIKEKEHIFNKKSLTKVKDKNIYYITYSYESKSK